MRNYNIFYTFWEQKYYLLCYNDKSFAKTDINITESR